MKKKLLTILCILALLMTVCACAPVSQSKAAEVHFIDVGQADSILIISQGQTVLIDAGTNSAGPSVLKYIQDQGITKIDYLIGTHPHEDHIGGLDNIINGLEIGQVILPRHSSNTKTYEDVLNAVKNKGLKITAAKAGNSFSAGECSFKLLAPDGEYDDTNNYSVVARMTVGSVSMLFTGDAETQSEQRILDSGALVKSDLLKVGHHGSSTSTCPQFLAAVAPKYAVISVGKDNSYGHPHIETLEALQKAGTEIYRTDILGTVIASTDGSKITFDTSSGRMPTAAPVTRPVSPVSALATQSAPSSGTQSTSSHSGTQGVTSQNSLYIGNKNTHKFHLPSCSGLPDQSNQISFSSREQAIEAGMTPCSRCNP